MIRLPKELQGFVLDFLVTDRKAIWNLCFVGNHDLLAVALPRAWQDVSFDIPFSQLETFKTRWAQFVSNEERTVAVRCLRLTLAGKLDFGAFKDAVSVGLSKLINVTHAHLTCFEVIPKRSLDAATAVELVASALPALATLTVEGCRVSNPSSSRAAKNLRQLRQLTARYCDPGIATIFGRSGKLQVVEMRGGNGEAYYDSHVRKIEGEYSGSQYFDTGLVSILSSCSDSLVRLNVACYDVDEEDAIEENDLEGTEQFFDELKEPLPCLEELVLDLDFTLTDFQAIIAGLRGNAPKLKYLKITVGPDRYKCQVPQYLFRGYDEGEPLSALKELWLPVDGIEQQETVISAMMAWAPTVEALFFISPKSASEDTFAKAASEFGERLPALRYISWANTKSFCIGQGRAVPAAKCAGPWWQEQRGVGNWWEHRPGETTLAGVKDGVDSGVEDGNAEDEDDVDEDDE